MISGIDARFFEWTAKSRSNRHPPGRPGKKAVVYFTCGGGHTEVNEAVPAVKYMGRLFDHLGYEILAEWYIVGAFHGKLEHLSTAGRLGDIMGRPNEADLQEIFQKAVGILKVCCL